jgi:hypothetical protein
MAGVMDEEHQTARMHPKYWATCFAFRFCGVSVPITVPLKRGRFRQLYDKPMFPGFLVGVVGFEPATLVPNVVRYHSARREVGAAGAGQRAIEVGLGTACDT